MLTIEGSGSQFCDNVTRRQFLKIGALGMGGCTLTQLLAAEAAAGTRSSHKSVIMVYLPGGPAHQDTFDMKPDAPSDIRGEFKPIKTNVSGIEVCEHLPKLAKMMDKFAIIRSLTGGRDEHASNICMSGYTEGEARQLHAPVLGSVTSRLLGPVDRTVPAYINLSARTQHMPYNDPGPGFIGDGFGALKPDGELIKDMSLKGVSLDRLKDRMAVMQGLDRYRRAVDGLSGIDEMHKKAFDILTSSKLVNALDLSKEDPKILARYGKGQNTPVGDASPMINEQFLAARRLVEAGARVVTVSYGFWDYHGSNFSQLKNYLPMLDNALSALVSDIHERGLDKDVAVIVWGEMGRTPKINKDAGRDHWNRVNSCLLAGGGMKTGQVIGSSTRFAEEPDDRPVHYKSVLASLYHHLGIDIANVPVPDITGRPNYILDGHEPVSELW